MPKLHLAPAPENFQRDSDSALLLTQAELIKLMSKLAKFEKQKADNKLNSVQEMNIFKGIYRYHKLMGFKYWELAEGVEVYKYHFGETNTYLKISSELENFLEEQSSEEKWNGIYQLDNKLIWEYRNNERLKLYEYLKRYLTDKAILLYRSAKDLSIINEALSEKYLTIGFARRFATYKRGNLLFRDIERLKSLLNHPERPIRFVFAGKAHPNDGMGQGIIKQIVEISKQPEFIGKIVFVEDYDIELAKKLVQGVDIWLNTPTRPLEASGTSGMKAVMNGVMNFSVLDGWWVEGYRENAGWALDEKRIFENQNYQDELDVETIYNKLEYEIAPMFYERNEDDVPVRWVEMVKNCIVQIAPHFTMKRMLDDYFERFYNKLFARSKEIKENDFALAMEIADWKKKVKLGWEQVKVESLRFSEALKSQLELGTDYQGEVVLDLNGLSHVKMGLEMVVIKKGPNDSTEIIRVEPMKLASEIDGKIIYQLKFTPPKAGNFSYGIRLFPLHERLPYRQDFCYVKWI